MSASAHPDSRDRRPWVGDPPTIHEALARLGLVHGTGDTGEHIVIDEAGQVLVTGDEGDVWVWLHATYPTRGCTVCGEPYYAVTVCEECDEESCALCQEASECCEWAAHAEHLRRSHERDLYRARMQIEDWHRRVGGSCLWDARVAVAEMEVRHGRRPSSYADPDKLRATRMEVGS